MFIIPGILGIVTIVLGSFGANLLGVGTFFMLPFGRQIQTAPQCSFGERIFNLIWLFLALSVIIPFLLEVMPWFIWVITFSVTLHDMRLLGLLFMPFGRNVVYKHGKVGFGEQEQV
jgi:uncharacterized membrane protein YccF (DUF307 family)